MRIKSELIILSCTYAHHMMHCGIFITIIKLICSAVHGKWEQLLQITFVNSVIVLAYGHIYCDDIFEYQNLLSECT